MASALNLARLAALVALFGFFLPWAEVSCSGAPLVHESGIALITGGGGAAATVPAHHDLWVAAALALVVLGLAGSMIAHGRRAAMIVTAASLCAAVASLIGVSQAVPSADVQAQLGGSAGQADAPLVRARLEYGYFITLAGLIVAIAAGGAALAGQRSPIGEPDRT